MTRLACRLLLFTTLFSLLAVSLLSVAPAWAEIGGNCSATFKGIDVSGLSSSSAGDAIDVDDSEVVVVDFASPAGFASHSVSLEIAGISRDVSTETDDGETQWSETVKVNDYAWLGAGLYKVSGSATLSDGSTCSGAVLINVKRFPLTTVAGGAAALATVVGVGALGTSTVASARAGGRASRKAEEWIVDEIEKVGSEPAPEPMSHEQAWIETIDLFFSPFFGRIPCAMYVLPSLVLTGMAMAMPMPEGGGPASASRDVKLRRVGWMPRIRVAAVVGGLLAGVGVVTLLQQFAVTPLTGTLAIIGIVGGLAVGLILPNLLQLMSVMRVNSTIASGERRLSDAIKARRGAQP